MSARTRRQAGIALQGRLRSYGRPRGHYHIQRPTYRKSFQCVVILHQPVTRYLQ